MQATDARRRAVRLIVVGLEALLAGVVLLASSHAVARHHLSVAQDHEVLIAARGTLVMPFDQNKTVHIFQKTAGGGIESVLANNADDQHEIGLIRLHLQEEATKFTEGSYEDPARIHGMDMPGLKELEAGHDQVGVAYADLPNGATISYTSSDPVLVEAIHAWFDRQLADHGSHAAGG